MQDQDKEHSQGPRSQDRILIHKRVWEDLTANELQSRRQAQKPKSRNLSVSWYEMSLREQERDGEIHWKFMSSKLRIKFRSDGGSNCTDRDWANLHLERKQQDKISVLSEFLRQITVPSSHSKDTHRRKHYSTRDAVSRSHS